MILTPVIVGLMFNFALNPQFGPLAGSSRGWASAPAVDILGGRHGVPLARSRRRLAVDAVHGTHAVGGHAGAAHPALEAAAVDGAGLFNGCG